MSRRALPPCILWLLLAVAPAQAATVTDMLGRPVTVPDRPLRVVSLAPSLTEIVFALGRGHRLVGVTDFCDYPPEARSKPRVGGPMTPDLERVVRLRPDLALATAEGNPRETLAQLARLHVPVFAVKAEGYAGILGSVEAVGRALRAEREAVALVQDIQSRVAEIRRAVAHRVRPRVLYLVWTDPLIAAGPATYIHDLMEMAGGENVVRERSVPYPRLSWEEVVGAAPEVILVASHRDGPDRPRIGEAWRGWQSVPAVRSGRIIAIPGDTIHRPGPRVAEGVERLARAIHPEVFARMGAR
jgi:iron complex transport system substrate-binding protein